MDFQSIVVEFNNQAIRGNQSGSAVLTVQQHIGFSLIRSNGSNAMSPEVLAYAAPRILVPAGNVDGFENRGPFPKKS